MPVTNTNTRWMRKQWRGVWLTCRRMHSLLDPHGDAAPLQYPSSDWAQDHPPRHVLVVSPGCHAQQHT